MRGAGAIDYERAKELARDEDVAVRRSLAANPATQPEILYFLATDEAPEVRRAIASNLATPRHADALLVRDNEASVRSHLAGKIATLLPQLDRELSASLRQITQDIVDALARDQDVQVRQTLSESVAHLTDAPHALVNMLARDVALTVAGPVLEHSPVLTDDDLLRIIADHPVAGALASIARRRTVAEKVADAIVASDDDGAIAAMLANPSAQIREATLDALLDKAPRRPSWHAPLVRRPALPNRAIRKLAGFVAASLVAELKGRQGLDEETASLLAARVREVADPDWAEEDERPADKARRLHQEEQLTEDLVATSVAHGERAFVAAALAELAALPLTAVEAVLRSQSPRAVTSLVWKAGLSMHLAVQVQRRVAHIAESVLLHPRDGNQFPLGPEDMEWQLEFFGAEA